MNISTLLTDNILQAISELYNEQAKATEIQIQKTKKEFEGDITLVVFPLVRYTKQSPETAANQLGKYLSDKIDFISNYNVVKGFLNIGLKPNYWIHKLQEISNTDNYGIKHSTPDSKKIVLEFSSPNTNKPLHLGHIRNNLLGDALSRILAANGHHVTRVNLVNDRGIHICKSMLAWKKWGNNETPESMGTKGDHLVGKYYVLFDKQYKAEIIEKVKSGADEDEARKNSELMSEAQRMLRKWEHRNKSVIDLWKMLNSWVYSGFEITYKNLGITFDKIYYESETYLEGKSQILSALKKGILKIRSDESVVIDLTADGLDEKVLLRSDGTSVYITQDIGTAIIRYDDYKFDEHIYVVGNEQDYHFKVLKLVLKHLGFEWSNALTHFSYGMVELPEGKMKSREGTVVDADDLIEEMIETARKTSDDLGKLSDISETEKDEIIKNVALGALRYYILKVDPKKNITFNPSESIDFNGNTGPFIQYTYARIQSIFRKAEINYEQISNQSADINTPLNTKEIDLMKRIIDYNEIVHEAGVNYSPALIANYVYELAREYNQFYHENQIIKEENKQIQLVRLQISMLTAKIIKSALQLLGINVPERM